MRSLWCQPRGKWRCLAVLFLAAGNVPAPGQSKKPVNFDSDILPIFQTNCIPCHGSAVKMKGLDLSTLAGVMKGGDAGPVVAEGDPDESRLYRMVQTGAMPKGGKPLAEDRVAVIGEWIKGVGKSSVATVSRPAEPLTEDDILPILLLRCVSCHGPQRREGGLALHTRAGMVKGGKSGPALAPGKPGESLIVKKLQSGEMPPKQGLDEVSVRPITKTETAKLIPWITQGAPAGKPADAQGIGPDPLVSDKDRQFWAFRPPARPNTPNVKNRDRVRNPIDAFVLAKLEAKGLSLAPE